MSDPASPPTGRPQLQRDPAAWRALGLVLSGMFVTTLLYPVGAIGVVLCVAGAVLAARARRAARRAGRPTSAATSALSVGVLGAVLGTVLTVTVYTFHDEISRYENCLSGANTQTARAACDAAMRDAVQQRIGLQVP